jgi:hypothetical protein
MNVGMPDNVSELRAHRQAVVSRHQLPPGTMRRGYVAYVRLESMCSRVSARYGTGPSSMLKGRSDVTSSRARKLPPRSPIAAVHRRSWGLGLPLRIDAGSASGNRGFAGLRKLPKARGTLHRWCSHRRPAAETTPMGQARRSESRWRHLAVSSAPHRWKTAEDTRCDPRDSYASSDAVLPV